MGKVSDDPEAFVNCRIGSLESIIKRGLNVLRVNCRIGSLENVMSI